MKIKALVREGTHREAMIHAAGANDVHGLPRSRKDLRRAISLLLDDDDLARLSDRTLAALAHCSDKTVAAVKRELGLENSTRTCTDKHGNIGEMNVSGIRRGWTAAAAVPVSTFHDLPDSARAVLKEALRVASGLTQTQYAFVRTWLQGHLPPKPGEAGELLTELESEEGQRKEMKF